MKKYLLLFLCFMCVTTESLGKEYKSTQSSRSRRRSRNRKRHLSRYFNLEVQADAADSEVADNKAVGNTGADNESYDFGFLSDDTVPKGESSSSDALEDQDTIVDPQESEQNNEPDKSNEEDVEVPQDSDVNVEGSQLEDDASGAEQEVSEPDVMHEDAEPPLPLVQDPGVYRSPSRHAVDRVQEYLEDTGIDINKKRETAVQLIDRAAEFFDQNSIEIAFNKFSHTKEFVKGDQYIFTYNQEGVCVAHPHNPELLWKNLYNMQDSYGRYPVQDMIKKGEQGGGWIEYVWKGAATIVYVKRVVKDNVAYFLASGFYTHSKHDSVVNLVKSAVAFFKNITKQGLPPAIAFASLGYKSGNFFQGDLHLFVVRFDGLMVAHGAHPEYVGNNVLDLPNEQGEYENQEIIEKLKRSAGGIWIQYTSKNALKRTYAEQIKDAAGNRYFIACGYYPDANRDRAVDLVRKAYSYMKSNGKTIAAREFTSQKNNDFRYGDLYITVYNAEGICVANGKEYELVGHNLMDEQDDDGNYYVRQIISKGQSGGGWVNYKSNKLFRSVYIEPIDIGVEQLIITCGVYPISKKETMMLLVKGAGGHLESSEFTQALRDFVKPKSKFKRGDLEIFVLEDSGICLAYGGEYDLIWRNLIQVKDDEGTHFIQKMINTAKHGAGLIQYKLNGAEKMSYVEPVRKDGKNYVVGSGYYL